ncbi:MAG: M23 family metallopeptidase [Sneathiella sp.]|nr:M23 family metallopeptidase [Sneathiella sp.]
MIRWGLAIFLWIIPLTAHANKIQDSDALKLSGSFTQGGLVFGQTLRGASVALDGRQIRVSNLGHFVLGFGRDHQVDALLTVGLPGGQKITRSISVEAREYKTEKIGGLPPSKVTPSAKFLKRIRKENGKIAEIRSLDTAQNWYRSGWEWPAIGRISGVFGSQRILNGIPKRPHYGLDVAAPVGTSVFASTDGIIRMSETDLYYTGGTVMIDHGYGLVSVYSHLSKLSVNVGDFVKQGMKIGEIGATGRASGPHLDWRLNWFKERLDPELLLGPMPKK